MASDTQDDISDNQPTADSHPIISPTTTEKATFSAQCKPHKDAIKTVFIMVAICLASFPAALDATMIPTALPTITETFQASDSSFAWIGSSFLIGAAAAMPLWSKTSDIFGRKPMLMGASLAFIAGSILCALSRTIGILILGRAVQGMGGGGLMVLPNIIISDLFSMRQRGLFLAIVGMVWSFATAIGPIIGGSFTQYVNWRWVFLDQWSVALPIEGLSLVLIFFLLDIPKPDVPVIEGLKTIDWIGGIALVGATIMLLFGLQLGSSTHLWKSASVVCLIIFEALIFIFAFVYEWKFASCPIVPIRILKNLSNLATLIVCVTHGVVYISVAYFMPLYFQIVLGYEPFLSGLWGLILTFTLAISTVVPGFYIFSTGKFRVPIWIAAIFLTCGLGLFIDWRAYRSDTRMVFFQVIAACGIGPLFQGPLVALQAHLKPVDIATGTSAFVYLRMLSAGISIIVGQVIFQNDMHKKLQMFRDMGLEDTLSGILSTGFAVSASSAVERLSEGSQKAVKEAITDSLCRMWTFYTIVAFLGAVVSIFIAAKAPSARRDKVLADENHGIHTGTIADDHGGVDTA
ncbi:putative major facilitator superfamily transporter [Pseudovirgaria hyperparasitica]|uniref:Major facilitator superfamily transporter n=1 Tax=Pseudovirgaria hyperparasitica TaxID=470096 RepID=A0A6A6W2L2_9PEZI|nr:putative major facilitator superfamily transporter [Pseudovirgaria hyperparasitica]KAF2756254.1 putative major facilitator superfamily transporter [Pseudovirgaria hyperparasitica]